MELANSTTDINEHTTDADEISRDNRECRHKDRKTRNEAYKQMGILNEETKQDSQPWRFIYQNMRGLISKNSRRKNKSF